MPRYFIEVSYKGVHYAGFQIQQNANSIQEEIKKALSIYYKADFQLTCSSRTDAGVHALSNFFHFDALNLPAKEQLDRSIYNINAILPDDIVVKRIFLVDDEAHCRFDAISREYRYYIYQQKDPFLSDRAYYYPYHLDLETLNKVAMAILHYNDFTSFSKRNTQVKSFNCSMIRSFWEISEGQFIYTVEANRFLRGMVRGLVGTMLKAGTGKLSVPEFCAIIQNKDASKTDFSVPATGLFLINVRY